MKLLVTGGAGFIGSNFIYYILDKYSSDEVVCLDALTYAGNYSTLEEAIKNKNFKFVKGDITDRQSVNKLFEQEKFDAVINFAAESHVDRSIENPEVFLKTNILGTQVLMDACLKYGVKRYHQVSTDEVYGDLPLDRPDLLFTETTPIKTSSPYSASKASADLLVLAYHRTFGLNATISRCSNNYGPYHFPEKLIPLMIINVLNNKPLPVYGKGENVRDWLYVTDHCSAIDLIVRNGKSGEVYNVGGNNERTNIFIVETIIKELGASKELITYVTDRKGHDLRYAIDSTKIQNELGWKPQTNFEDGIKKTIKWYCDNKTWWEKLINHRAGENMNTENQDLELQIKKLETELRKKNTEYDALLMRFDKREEELSKKVKQQKYMINAAIYECEKISATRSIKFIHLIKRIKNQLVKGSLNEKKNFFKWLFGHLKGTNGIQREYNPLYRITDILNNETECMGVFQRAYEEEADNYTVAFKNEACSEVKKMRKILDETDCKGIVVYPHIIHWETTQTPQHLLRELAKQGYICIFAEHNNLGHILREVEKNLFVMSESDMIASVYDKNPIIFCTWACSMGWIEKIEKKYLWYHILDKIDIFACYDDEYDVKHKEIIEKADLVTYVATELKRYAYKRNDTVYLPNGVNVDDFIVNLHEDVTPKEIKSIIESGRKIIGYYGLISTWFDIELLAEVADRNKDCVFVLIGDCNIDLDKYARENIVALGKKNYKELADYAKFFDVAIIPFEISDMMDCVSPIKFFEYRALGLPVVSSYMKEMEQYVSDDVLVAYDADDFCRCIKQALEPSVREKAKKDGLVFAKQQLWKNRAELLCECFDKIKKNNQEI